ncbi:MAG TPA: FAD binding domain-containing protein [Salinarimonas sp.]|jgi:N-methylhydantoinase B|nr:FAD binding domain-containing protein [Salinarimonas sp.]
MRYFRPATLDEALAIRREHDVVPLAGATDVYPAAVGRHAWGDPTHRDVLDLSRIEALRGVAVEGDHLRIGALATWTELIRADLPPLLDGLKRAAREVGGVQVQNRATIVGNACTASPAGDGIPNLMALDAAFEIAGPLPRLVPARDFFTGYRATACGPDELVTGIRIPLADAQGHFVKLGARRYLVISIAMVAAVVETDAAGAIARARLAVGACSAAARRLDALEADLVGVPLARAAECVEPCHLAHLTPIDDVRASAGYRLAAALTLTRDALDDLARPQARAA